MPTESTEPAGSNESAALEAKQLTVRYPHAPAPALGLGNHGRAAGRLLCRVGPEWLG